MNEMERIKMKKVRCPECEKVLEIPKKNVPYEIAISCSCGYKGSPQKIWGAIDKKAKKNEVKLEDYTQMTEHDKDHAKYDHRWKDD